MEKSPRPVSASAGAAAPEEKAQEEKPRRRWRVPPWTGFGRKTLWDWLQLLIVPAILIVATFVWSATQSRSDNKREDRRIAADRAAAEEARRDATLQTYLDRMSDLIIHEDLLSTPPAVEAVAETLTAATVRRLDGARKAQVVLFLSGANLLEAESIMLEGADLTGADLRNVSLDTKWIGAANLRGANLHGADLVRSHLRSADLRDADLGNADLGLADLTYAQLQGADLTNAFLAGAVLEFADIAGADFKGAIVKYVDFTGTAGLVAAKNLDLGRYLAGLAPKRKRSFFEHHGQDFAALSPEELAKFNLSEESLRRFAREAGGR